MRDELRETLYGVLLPLLERSSREMLEGEYELARQGYRLARELEAWFTVHGYELPEVGR
jgi:hypothetical protein